MDGWPLLDPHADSNRDDEIIPLTVDFANRLFELNNNKGSKAMEEKPRGFMSHLPPGTYTRVQVAREIGKSKDTVRRWHQAGWCVPSRTEKFGSRWVFLYTEDDLALARQLAREIRTGPLPQGQRRNWQVDALTRRMK